MKNHDNSDFNVRVNHDSAGLVEARGFKVAGVHCDVRGKGDGRLDLALIASETPCTAAGVFTQNDVKAAPVLLCQEILTSETHRAVVANSGNANACTGDQGRADANEMAALAAEKLGIDAGEVYVCSTGRIGRALPMDNIRKGVVEAASQISDTPEQSLRAAEAILTSDTCPKTVSACFAWGGQTVTVAGMAKGAGMIRPDMATMLAFIVTDARVSKILLQQILSEANTRSLNAITVDGDMSTNDTVLLLANGASGVTVDGFDAELLALFREAVQEVCDMLAEKIVGDGERVTKFVTVTVSGAHSKADAERVARAIGDSLLVKTSWFGSDPNWGRLLSAAGAARVGLNESVVDLYYNETPVLLSGQAQEQHAAAWKEIVSGRSFKIYLNLNLGNEPEQGFVLRSTDLSTGYVDFNKAE